MGCSLTDPVGCLTSLAGGAAGSIADSAFSDIAKDFADAAGSAVNWLWNQISGATAISLTGPAFAKDLAIVSALAVVVATGLFVIQVIASVLRREASGLARALKGLLIALVGSLAAIATTTVLLAAVDSLSAGFVAVATGDSMQTMGTAILSATAITAVTNPAAALLLALVVLGAVIFVWGAMMVRKLLIIVAAVFAPLAFAGATSDISTSWVRRWIETMVALVISKLILVIIFVIGLGVLTGGLGEVSQTGTGASATQSITQTIVGALILLMAGFAPWLAIKVVHFGGEQFGQIHGHAQSALAGAQTLAAAPRKAQSLAGGLARMGSAGSGASVGARTGLGAQAHGTPSGSGSPGGSLSTRTSGGGPPSPGAGSRSVTASAGGAPGSMGAAAPELVGVGAAVGAASATKTALDQGTGRITDVSTGVAPGTPPSTIPPSTPPPTSPPKGKPPADG
jgi:type IV secretion system protein TrbL